MPLKKVDSRIRTLVENGVILNHRSLFVIVGDHGRDQVVLLHHMLSKAVLRAHPSVLWCYKKELGFSSHRKKRMRQLQKKIKSGTLDVKEDDPFELFIAATNIRYCYYSETHKILGNTYGMCVLQDFEALTPNLLARTVETVEGGGLVVILLRSMQSLKQLYTMSMDVHARYRTETHKHVVARFNERFLLSLTDCSHCIVLDDQLNVLPISSHILSITPLPRKTKEQAEKGELEILKDNLTDVQPVGHLVSCCRTLDQAKALLKIVETISEQALRSTIAMTASRGRGKSAALGLAIAAAVAFGYSNIFVTSPSPENLTTLFQFLLKGFDAIDYQEHEHYEVIQSTNPEFNHAVVRVNVFHQHRQTIQYIHPADAHKCEQAELLCIDEAAAIPLPLVKRLMGPYLILMASTINGYEGTGRSLSLKLIDDLRKQTVTGTAGGRVLKEISLDEPIRYAPCDPVEAWLHQLLCLDAANVPNVLGGCPSPQDCNLYHVNRDTLFCYHKASEVFLQQLMSLYVSSHYKNSPNDLQLLSDAPAHHLFVLVGPVNADTASLPEVLCVIQVCLEGAISKRSVMSGLAQGKRAAGDLIPWTLSQQFVDPEFAGLSGARVVRIATHPDLQGMGYGTKAMQLLLDYYSGKMSPTTAPPDAAQPEQSSTSAESAGLLREVIAPRASLPPLLSDLSECPPDPLDYIGVSFGLTESLLKFWSKKNGFVPVYLRQTANELTGEHSCIMLRCLTEDSAWLDSYTADFRLRYLSLLGYHFRSFSPSLALRLLKTRDTSVEQLTYDTLSATLSKCDLQRLEQFTRNTADRHLITDLLPTLARLHFTQRVQLDLNRTQAALLLGMGLQHKDVEILHKELGMETSQLLGQFKRVLHKFVQLFSSIEEGKAAGELTTSTGVLEGQKPLQSLDKELSATVKEFQAKQSKERAQLLESTSLDQYAVTGQEEDWSDALGVTAQTIVSVKGTATAAGGKRKASSSQSHKKTKTKRKKVVP